MSAAATVVETEAASVAPLLDVPNFLAPPPTHLLLKLKRRVRRVRWAEGTVDNEDLCRKKSKNCCIFHAQRPSGDDTSSDDEASRASGDEAASGQGEPVAARKRQRTDGDGADAPA